MFQPTREPDPYPYQESRPICQRRLSLSRFVIHHRKRIICPPSVKCQVPLHRIPSTGKTCEHPDAGRVVLPRRFNLAEFSVQEIPRHCGQETCMRGLFDPNRPDPKAVRRIKMLVVERFGLPESTTLAVAELRCHEPGLPTGRDGHHGAGIRWLQAGLASCQTPGRCRAHRHRNAGRPAVTSLRRRLCPDGSSTGHPEPTCS